MTESAYHVPQKFYRSAVCSDLYTKESLDARLLLSTNKNEKRKNWPQTKK